MRTFDSGATRDENTDKPDYRGFISPLALKMFGAYMHKHRVQADGTLRASDNWKKGIPIQAYLESFVRHEIDFWEAIDEENWDAADELACALFFNLQGYLHERVKIRKKPVIFECFGNTRNSFFCEQCVKQGVCVLSERIALKQP